MIDNAYGTVTSESPLRVRPHGDPLATDFELPIRPALTVSQDDVVWIVDDQIVEVVG